MSTSKEPPLSNRVLGGFVVLSVFGIVGLFVTGLLGFEEPNGALLLLSSTLTLAAPLAVLVHLSGTKDLTREEKRVWIQELAGPRTARAFVTYLTCHDRRATARRLAERR